MQFHIPVAFSTAYSNIIFCSWLENLNVSTMNCRTIISWTFFILNRHSVVKHQVRKGWHKLQQQHSSGISTGNAPSFAMMPSFSSTCLLFIGKRSTVAHDWTGQHFYFLSDLSNEKHMCLVNLAFLLIKLVSVHYWGLGLAGQKSIRWSF